MCGSEQEEEHSVRSMGQWDNIGNIIDKMLRFNDHHIEHELERVTSLRTLCEHAANSLMSKQISSSSKKFDQVTENDLQMRDIATSTNEMMYCGNNKNFAPVPANDVKMRETATSTSEMLYCGGPSEI